MASSDFLHQVGGSWQSRDAADDRARGHFGILRRPSFASLIWGSLDLATVVVAGVCALRFRAVIFHGYPETVALLSVLRAAPPILALYVAWFALLLILFARSYGLYAPIIGRGGLHEQRMTVQAGLTAGLLLCGTLYLTKAAMVSRFVVMLMVLITTVLLCARRAVWRRVVYRRYREGLETRNVLIVGAGRVAHALRNHLQSLGHLGFRFKGFVALSEEEAESGDAEIIGDVRNCLLLARSLFVDEIFFSVPAERSLVISIVEEARTMGIGVRVVPDLYDGIAWNAPVEYVGQFPTIPLHRRDLPMGVLLLKRLLDTTASALALVVLSPLTLMLALAIKIESRGPVFYRAQRIGRKGRTFVCYKFRTMCCDADTLKDGLLHRNQRDGILFKMADDPRVTRIGRFLRKYSIDELPQFYNVLRGDMSMVGPRPPMSAEVAQYNLAHLRRLDVLPGMTGLWQVEARQDPSFDYYISLDTAYVENWSLWLDLKILVRTVGVVFAGTGS
jgi:exopolysaccharide biosynthesis polyprenyl glycosylphosphotransferase